MSQLARTFLSWIIVAVLMLMSNQAISESRSKIDKPIINDQSQSLSAPSSDSPQEEMARERKLENENLSSPPADDPSTNNAPFDEKIEKSSSEKHKHH